LIVVTSFERLSRRRNLPIKIVQLDVDNDESVDAAFTQILNETSQIDVLINNAGVGTLLRQIYDRFTEGFETADLKAAANLMSMLARSLPERTGKA